MSLSSPGPIVILAIIIFKIFEGKFAGHSMAQVLFPPGNAVL